MDIVGNRNLAKHLSELADQYQDKIAVYSESKEGVVTKISYRELDELTNKVGNYLRTFGIQKRDRVVIHMTNSIDIIVAMLSCAKIGAIAVIINPLFEHSEVDYVLEKTTPSLILLQTKYATLYDKVLIDCDKSIDVIQFDKSKSGFVESLGIKEYVENMSNDLSLPYKVKSSDIAEIIFTSGTTSKPKGAQISHYNLIFAGYYTSWQSGIRPEDIYLTVMPFCHVDAQCTAFFPTIISGATFVLLEKYSARKFWEQVRRYKATITEIIPKILLTLMFQPKDSLEKNHYLRLVFYYLDISVETMQAFCSRFSIPMILNSYGMTETIVGVIGDRRDELRRFPSIGRVGFCYDVKIVDKDKKEVPPNVHGEICIKGELGKTLFAGYYQDAAATEKTYQDGWLYTGDIGYVDEDGYYFFVDRNINLIKVSGENVSSTEVESVINEYYDVYECAVLGVPNKLNGSIIRAYVVPRKGTTLDIDNLDYFCKMRLSNYKCPEEYIVVDSLPKTASGKVKKGLLQKEAIK